MKYRIDLSSEDYFNLISVLVLAYSKPSNNMHAKRLLETIINNHIKIED